jgi:chemotaxis signal transduction protein
MSGSTAEEILARRARELARPADPEPSGELVELLVVAVENGARYALETRHVRAIVRNRGLARLPVGSGSLLGVIATRGDAVPVADLASLLDSARPDPHRRFVVVIDGAAPPLGLLVDEAQTVLHVPRARLRRGTRTDSSAPGVTVLVPGGIVLLDAEAVLADPRLRPTVRQSALTTAVPKS